MPRAKGPAQKKGAVEKWNRENPVGTPVTVRTDDGELRETVTVSKAQKPMPKYLQAIRDGILNSTYESHCKIEQTAAEIQRRELSPRCDICGSPTEDGYCESCTERDQT